MQMNTVWNYVVDASHYLDILEKNTLSSRKNKRIMQKYKYSYHEKQHYK